MLKIHDKAEYNYKPVIKNSELIKISMKIKNNKDNLILSKKKSSQKEKEMNQYLELTHTKFLGFDSDINENEIYYNERAKDSVDSSRILTRIDQKKIKFADISFESQVHDIYKPKYSSDESKENINFSINTSNFSSNMFNCTRQNNMLNNNLKTGVSNSEILSPENISVINKSDNLQDANNKNSQSLICFSHINKFSFLNSAIINNSDFKSNTDSKNNSHILINDKKLMIDDNFMSKSTSKT